MKKLYPILAILLLSVSLRAQDQKLSALTLITPTDDDLTYVVDDPAGTPASHASTVAAFRSYVPLTLNGSNAAALTVGPNGTTNPTLRIITNTASGATGLSVTNKAAGSGISLGVLSSGSNENLNLAGKGTGYVAAPILNVGGGTFDTNYSMTVRSVDNGDFTGIKVMSLNEAAAMVIGRSGLYSSNGILIDATSGLTTTGAFKAPLYQTTTNCTDSAGAAACGAAPAGSVVIDASATTVVVSTTAVTATSQIFITEDSSLSTRLSVTCNSTISSDGVTARTAGTSFTITTLAAPVANPRCFSYFIVN